MSEKVTKLVQEIQEKNKELGDEIDRLSKQNLSLLDEIKKKTQWDEELLKEWYEEYWHTYPSSDNEWFVAVPKFIPFSLGWLDHTTKGYNVFKINQYTQWLGDLPDFLRKELNIKEPDKIFVSEGNVIFDEGKEEEVKDKYGDMLSSVSKGTARIKLGKEFDVIAKIIENGSLPFVPRPVDNEDIVHNSTNIGFEGKYKFQKEAWDNFIKSGAVGIYWMTGAGKDIFSCYALSRIRVKKDNELLPNLFVSPNLTILEQLKKEYFPKFAPELLKEVEEGRLLLVTYQGYEKVKNIEFGLTIYGECHVLPANTFSRLATIKTKYRIGQCLDKNTLINTPKGKRKIKDLRIGDKVITYNFKNQRYENKCIKNIWKNKKEEVILKVLTPTGIKKIICSLDHKFYSKGKFIKAKDLSSDMSLLYIRGEKI
jgi:DNA excision repair protein ERCC-3